MAWQGEMTAAGETQIPRFGGWAGLYHRYRPSYPPALFALLQAECVRHEVCIDIGAGTGQATVGLAELFKRVIAVEPDPDMAALIPRMPGVEVLLERAESAPIEPGTADAVVAATSLHWMDEQAALARAADWLRPGGVMLACAFATPHFPGAGPALLSAVQTHQRRVRPFTHDRIVSWRGTERTLAAAPGFEAVRPFEVYADFVWGPEELAGFLLTMAAGRAFAEMSGDPDGCRDALSAELARASNDEPVAVRFPLEGAWMRRAL